MSPVLELRLVQYENTSLNKKREVGEIWVKRNVWSKG